VPLALGLLAARAVREPDDPECVVAARWVEANRDALPTTLSEISSYTLAYRKAIFRALPRATQVDLWREQLDYYMRETHLTRVQREFLGEVRAEIGEYFGPEKADAAKERYVARAIALLGRERTAQIFTNLGVNAPVGRLEASCSCNQSDDWCSSPITGPTVKCVPDADGCTVTQDGCGWWWCKSCNGECGAEQ
jgi:hypothetical protein